MYIYIYIYKQLVLHHSFMLVNIYRYQKSLVSRIQDDVMLIRKFNHFCGSLMVAPGTLGIDLKTFRELKKKNGKKQMKKILLSTNTFLFERPKESCCYGKKTAPAFSNEQSPLYVTPPTTHPSQCLWWWCTFLLLIKFKAQSPGRPGDILPPTNLKCNLKRVPQTNDLLV